MNIKGRSSIKAYVIAVSLILSCVIAVSLILSYVSVADKFIILSDSVKVTATLNNPPDDEPFEAELTIERGNDRFRISTSIYGAKDQDEAISVLKRVTGWKEGYLFVREDCGGGNAWRCDLDHVFAIRQGRLNHLGEVAAGMPWDSLVGKYKDGYFTDIYNKFEINDLTSHAHAPGMTLFLQEKGGHLQVNLEYTCLQNREVFMEDAAKIAGNRGKEFADENSRAVYLIPPILSNAVYAKYCRRGTELSHIMRVAKSVLTKHELQKFLAILAQVVPGEKPEPEPAEQM